MIEVGYCSKKLKPWVDYEIYKHVSIISQSIAHDFYERIENKPVAVLQRYEKIVIPNKGFWDFISYIFDQTRVGRHAATQEAILVKTRPDLLVDK